MSKKVNEFLVALNEAMWEPEITPEYKQRVISKWKEINTIIDLPIPEIQYYDGFLLLMWSDLGNKNDCFMSIQFLQDSHYAEFVKGNEYNAIERDIDMDYSIPSEIFDIMGRYENDI